MIYKRVLCVLFIIITEAVAFSELPSNNADVDKETAKTKQNIEVNVVADENKNVVEKTLFSSEDAQKPLLVDVTVNNKSEQDEIKKIAVEVKTNTKTTKAERATETSKKNDTITVNNNDKKENKDEKLNFFGLGRKASNNSYEQNIEIKEKYQNNQEAKVIVIKDGVKNINITFKPEISVSGCNGFCANSKEKKRRSVKESSNKKKVKTSNNVKKKKNVVKPSGGSDVKIKKESPVAAKENNTVKTVEKVATSKENNKDTEFFYNDVKTLDKNNESPATSDARTIRQIYEANGNERTDGNDLSCNSGKCDNLPGLQNNGTLEKNTIIKQETPVYVINRIISVDDDMNLTDEAIEQLVQENDDRTIKRATLNQDSSFKTAYVGGTENAFVNQYNIVDVDRLKYGEVAFVNDYND